MDHFSLPFIDQILKGLDMHEFYYFLDGLSGYYQVAIAPKDQEKTTFICSFGTFSFKRMLFRLCNPPATFQRCLMSILSNLVEKFIDVFMYDFCFFFGTSFDDYLNKLILVLECYIECYLTLSWKKTHFKVQQRIMFGYVISNKIIKVIKLILG